MAYFGGVKASPIIIIPGKIAEDVQPAPRVDRQNEIPPMRRDVAEPIVHPFMLRGDHPEGRPDAVRQVVHPVVHPVVLPAIANEKPYVELNELEKDNMFWTAIDAFAWPAHRHNVERTINTWGPVKRQVFKESYAACYEMMSARLTADGMFNRNGIVALSEQAKIISHVIASGRDQYTTLINDLEFLQFIILDGNCVSFDAVLPANIAQG
jgi:hypothetical protein